MADITLYKPEIDWLVTKYEPKYCKMLIEYAYNNFDIIGFFGENCISQSASEQWEKEYEEWREAMEMAEYRIQAGLNKYYHTLLQFARGTAPVIDKKTGRAIPNTGRPPDFDMVQKIIFKLSDLNLKVEKDTGKLKRRGQDELRKNKNKSQSINENDTMLATNIAQEIIKNL